MPTFELVMVEHGSTSAIPDAAPVKLRMQQWLYALAVTEVTNPLASDERGLYYLTPEVPAKATRYDGIMEMVEDWLDRPEEGSRELLRAMAKLYRNEQREPIEINDLDELKKHLPAKERLDPRARRNLYSE